MQPKRIREAVRSVADAHLNRTANRAADFKRHMVAGLRGIDCTPWLISKAARLGVENPHLIEQIETLYGDCLNARSPAGYFHNGLKRLCRQHGIAWRQQQQ